MKELSIEEKAKAYDEALERAKGFRTDECKDVAEYIFPELAESEDYDRGYYDALKWVYEHTYGDNYKLSVKTKMQEFIKG